MCDEFFYRHKNQKGGEDEIEQRRQKTHRILELEQQAFRAATSVRHTHTHTHTHAQYLLNVGLLWSQSCSEFGSIT